MVETTLKGKTAVAKLFFSAFHGLEISEWGKTENPVRAANAMEKQIFQKLERDSSRNSVLNEKNDESVLGDIFA